MTHHAEIWIIAAVVLLGFLALPAIVAAARQHPERKLIYDLSLLGAFSFVLWSALLVWAASDKREDAVISKYVARLRSSNRLGLMVGVLLCVGAGGALAYLH